MASLSPARQSVVGAARAISLLAKQVHRFEREDAVGSATVRHDLTLPRELAKPALEFGDGNGQSAGDVSRFVFRARSDVDEGHVTVAQSSAQLRQRHGIERVLVVEDRKSTRLNSSH